MTIEGDGLVNVRAASFASGTVTFLLTDVAGSTLAWQQAAWADRVADGRKLSISDALAHCSTRPGQTTLTRHRGDSLIPTEADAVGLVAQGLTFQQIAKRLLIGVATVKPTSGMCSPY